MALLEALDNAEGDVAGQLRGMDISDYVHNLIGDLQTPDFDVKKKLDVVLLENRQPALIEVSLRIESFTSGDEVEIRDGAKQHVTSITPSSASFLVPLKAGLYKMILQGTSRSQLFEVPSATEIVI
jgi:hypothetical protein